MPHIAAKLTADVIAHQQLDDPALGLRLQRDLSFRLLQHRAEKGRQRQRFGQKPLDRRRIVVACQNRVERGPETRKAPPRITRRNSDAKRDVRVQLV